MAAQEAEIEGRLREMHTRETQLAAKQRAIEEYVTLVRLYRCTAVAILVYTAAMLYYLEAGGVGKPCPAWQWRGAGRVASCLLPPPARLPCPALPCSSIPPPFCLQGKADALRKTSEALESLHQRQEAGEEKLKVRGSCCGAPAAPGPAC